MRDVIGCIMPIELQRHAFPYATYRDYVTALSATDNAYDRLGEFLAWPRDTPYGCHVHQETQVPRSGSVTIIDSLEGKAQLQVFVIGEEASEKAARKCICALEERPSSAKTRVILLSYHRDSFTGEYTGVNTEILDAIGTKYHVHPEVMMWHFGSDYGLDKRFFPFAKSHIPSAVSNRTFCHLQSDHSLFSCCMGDVKHGTGNSHAVWWLLGTLADFLTLVVMFARNRKFPNWSLLTSRLVYLESSLPIPLPKGLSPSRWSNALFMEAIKQTKAEDVLANDANPIEYVIPYAQMILINATFVMDQWAMKVMHPVGKTSSNLEIHYDKQVDILNNMRLNLDALKMFTSHQSSARWMNMIRDYKRVLQNTEQQINVVLAQRMTYRAAMASLDESRMGIEHAKRGMEQNARVKRLTQLALFFIPLSFSTSIFGMNLEMLGTGNAKAWMVLIAILSAYVVTSLLWVLIDWRNVKTAWVAGTAQSWWRMRLFHTELHEDSRLPGA